jgi:hypothetical protein
MSPAAAQQGNEQQQQQHEWAKPMADAAMAMQLQQHACHV